MNNHQIGVRNLMIKFLEELHFEEIIQIFDDGKQFKFILSETVYFTFKAYLSVWNYLIIDKKSFIRFENDTVSKLNSISEFLFDLNRFMKMDEKTLAQFIQEAHHTLYSDKVILKKQKNIIFSELVSSNLTDVEQFLSGHPKVLLNKGRLGWGKKDLENYSPESSKGFSLNWLAIKKSHLIFGNFGEGNFELSKYLDEIKIRSSNIDWNLYDLVAVHPWQYENIILFEYQEYFDQGIIVDIGTQGELFNPQASIRTLSAKKARYDVKLSLSILNTSCVRGIPIDLIEDTPEISYKLEKLINQDEFLLKNKIFVLKDIKTSSFVHPSYNKLNEAPYRFKEYLGCIWRESANSKISTEEKVYSTGSLLLENDKGSFFEALLEKSQSSIQLWLKAYFEVVVIPLYHLQHKYGIGFVSHGQNILLITKNGNPIGLGLKDFQGDLRLSENSPLKDTSGFNKLKRLPPGHLIHDLLTGHFVSFLRYFSKLLVQRSLLKEKDFYLILRLTIINYHKEISYLPADEINILMKSFEKILINKVRFVAGYDESSQRLLPLLGSEIINPIGENCV